MHDSEVIAPFAGDRSGGLTEAYDRYADPLYKYCLAWLGEPTEAAGAVRDTFVIAAARAAARLVDLREPNRLRAWLYAVARNECQRITRPGRPVFASAQAPDATAADAYAGEDAERARLLDAATRGLTPDEREVIELELRHGLALAEVAAVVGVSGRQANALASRARKHLEACLGAVVVARAGRRNYCDSLSRMLTDWDGQLTVPLRKQLHRHIGRCPACSTRRDLELHPAQPLDQSRGDALAAAGAAGLQVAPGPPDALKARTLALAAGQDPDAIAHRAAILGRAGNSTPTASPSQCRDRRRHQRAGTRVAQPAGGDGSPSRRAWRPPPSSAWSRSRSSTAPGTSKRGRRTAVWFRAADRALSRSAALGLAEDLAYQFGDAGGRQGDGDPEDHWLCHHRPDRLAGHAHCGEPCDYAGHDDHPCATPRRQSDCERSRQPRRRRPPRPPRGPWPSPPPAARWGTCRAIPRSRSPRTAAR